MAKRRKRIVGLSELRCRWCNGPLTVRQAQSWRHHSKLKEHKAVGPFCKAKCHGEAKREHGNPYGQCDTCGSIIPCVHSADRYNRSLPKQDPFERLDRPTQEAAQRFAETLGRLIRSNEASHKAVLYIPKRFVPVLMKLARDLDVGEHEQGAHVAVLLIEKGK